MPLPENKSDNWITSAESKTLVHQWRSEEQAILIGYNTLMADNPLLTARLAHGKNPTRLILTRHIDFPENLNAFNSDAKTIVFNAMKDEAKENVEFVKIDWNCKAQQVLDYCFKNNISSLIIEGGTNTIYNFTNINAWDEARIFVNPNKKFEQGISAPEINLNNITPKHLGSDLLYSIFNT